MRIPVLLLLLLLPGCGDLTPATIALTGVNIASVAVLGRSVADLGISAISGRDCSIVRLDRGEPYCAPIEPVQAGPFCSRSLGAVDCWANPERFPIPPTALGDTPPPTEAQERYRHARWPKSLGL